MKDNPLGPHLAPLLPEVLQYVLSGPHDYAFHASTPTIVVKARATQTLWLTTLCFQHSTPWRSSRPFVELCTRTKTLDGLLRLLKRASLQLVAKRDPVLYDLRCKVYEVSRKHDVTVPEGNTRPTSFDDMTADDCAYWLNFMSTQPLKEPS